EAGRRLEVRGAVVVSRDADGKVDVVGQGAETVAGGAALGGAAGLGGGLVAPAVLPAGLGGAGGGALVGHPVNRDDEKELDAELDESLPAGSAAVVVLVGDASADRVSTALVGAVKTLRWPADPTRVAALEQALGGAGRDLPDASGS